MFRGKILLIEDSASIPTGYGNQANMIFSEMVKRGWEVYQLACNCWDIDSQLPQSKDGFYYYNGIKLIKNEELGKTRDSIYPSKEYVARLYNDIKPDIVFSNNDFYRVASYTDISEDFLDHWIHYLPIDNQVGHDDWNPVVNRLHYLLFMSSFGWELQSPRLPNIRYIDAIYNAVPSNIFKPLDKPQIKKNHGINNMFTILTVGRHQPRKMIYHTAEAVCRFLSNHNDAIWLCKSDPHDPAMHEEPLSESDLNGIAKKYNVQDRVQFVTGHLSSEQMNDFYNCGEVFIHLSGGEGFGIPYVEAMLAEIPCILNDNTTSPELTGGWEFGLPVKIKEKKYVKMFNLTYDVGDLDEANKQLEFCYNDWKNNNSNWLKDAGRKARNFQKEWCGVENVCDKLEEVFQRVIRYNNKVLWHSFFGRGVGYSITSETIIPALERLGYDVYINDWYNGCSPILEPHFRELYQKWLNNKDKIDFNECPQFICWLMEAFNEAKGRYKIGWCLNESNSLRDYYVSFCNSMDYIATSSDFCRKIEEKSGVCNPIYLFPPCIDSDKFKYIERERNDNKPFTFLHIGVVQDRKNSGQLVESYIKAFPDNGKTKLIIKSNEFGNFDELISVYGKRNDIEYIYTNEKPLNHQEYLDLLKRADCYINISHGEGIGNPDMEALATGLPVIGSNWDTRGLFLDDEVGWMLSYTMGPAYTGLYDSSCGEWAYYKTDEIVEKLRYAASHIDECRAKGKKGSERMHSKFNSDIAALELDKLFMDIYAKKVATIDVDFFNTEEYYTQQHKYDKEWYDSVGKSIATLLNGSVLDIGCGRGYLTKPLLDAGLDVYGVDISSYAVEHPIAGCEGRLKLGNMTEHLPYLDKEFDWGVCFLTLEHIPERFLDKTLSEMKRVCKKLFIEVPMILAPGMGEEIKKEDKTHVNIHTFDWWRLKLKKAGLKVDWFDNRSNMIVSPIDDKLKPLAPGERILVGIPTKDRLSSLNRLLDSLIGQSLPYFDVCIVDDSKYEQIPLDGEFEKKVQILKGKNKETFLLRGYGINQAAAHNLMIDLAEKNGYRFIFRIDDDVTLEPSHLEKIYTAFLKDEKCEFAAMGGIILDPYSPKEAQVAPPNWRSLPEFSGKANVGVNLHQIVQYPDTDFRDDADNLYSSYMYRVPLLQSVGGFPSYLSAVAFREETIPLYELHLQGYKMGIVTKALGYHFHEQKGGCRSVDPDKAEALYKQDEKLYRDKLATLEAKYQH